MKWLDERFTIKHKEGRPAACHALYCEQAVRITHSSIDLISQISSAMGINCFGLSNPSSGCRQRTRASAQTIFPVEISTWGW